MATVEMTGKFSYRPHPHLYEINTWVWLEELSAKLGRRIVLRDVPDEQWEHLQKLGFDFVYLMGVWKRSGVGRRMFRTDSTDFTQFDAALQGWKTADVVGSPYSIQDYSPDPRIGTFDDLDEIHRKLRTRGMGLILDFVPNHTGFDHAWTQEHPERYVLGSEQDFRQNPAVFYLVENDDGQNRFVARGKDPYFAPWRDVAQLNYFNPDCRAGMIEILKTIARFCDGVRCDMAMLVTNEVFSRTWGNFLGLWPPPATEFWQEATAQLPDFVWLAEVYWDMEARMQQLGFRFTYDKRLYDRLLGSSSGEVRAHLTADIGYQSKLARFLENHDEPRAAAAFPREKTTAVALLLSTLPGMRFYHHGQLAGKKIRVPMPLARAVDEPVDQETLAIYERVLGFANNGIFHSGEWNILEVKGAGDDSFGDLIAYGWREGNDCAVAVVNLGSRTAQGMVQGTDTGTLQRCVYRDLLSGNQYVYDRATRGSMCDSGRIRRTRSA
jgi:Alpha amylase, catalytic domain